MATETAPPAPPTPGGLTGALSRAPLGVLTAYAAGIAFCTYFCMYAFRKPFDVVTFTGIKFAGTAFDLKTVCVISQIIGYMLSKYMGTKVCSEVPGHRRAYLLVCLILVAECGLLLFAVLPANVKPLAMVLNGLPLGMVWGLCVRYLEGRRASEVMVMGMSCSYIIAGAMTRDIGQELVMRRWGAPEAWMPAATGALFFLPFVLAVFMLNMLPPPSARDVAARSARATMDGKLRRAFLAHFGIGFGMLLAAYFFLTAFRDFRDHYQKELLVLLGLGEVRAIFTQTEKWAAFGVIVALAGLNLISGHKWALRAVYGVIVGGFALVGIATALYQTEVISGYWWMALIGVGLYLAYVPFGAILFERMMAAGRFAGTAVFAIQLADAIGYTGSVLVQICRDLLFGDFDRLQFFVPFAYVVSGAGALLMTASAVVVLSRTHRPLAPASPAEPGTT